MRIAKSKNYRHVLSTMPSAPKMDEKRERSYCAVLAIRDARRQILHLEEAIESKKRRIEILQDGAHVVMWWDCTQKPQFSDCAAVRTKMQAIEVARIQAEKWENIQFYAMKVVEVGHGYRPKPDDDMFVVARKDYEDEGFYEILDALGIYTSLVAARRDAKKERAIVARLVEVKK